MISVLMGVAFNGTQGVPGALFLWEWMGRPIWFGPRPFVKKTGRGVEFCKGIQVCCSNMKEMLHCAPVYAKLQEIARKARRPMEKWPTPIYEWIKAWMTGWMNLQSLFFLMNIKLDWLACPLVVFQMTRTDSLLAISKCRPMTILGNGKNEL